MTTLARRTFLQLAASAVPSVYLSDQADQASATVKPALVSAGADREGKMLLSYSPAGNSALQGGTHTSAKEVETMRLYGMEHVGPPLMID